MKRGRTDTQCFEIIKLVRAKQKVKGAENGVHDGWNQNICGVKYPIGHQFVFSHDGQAVLAVTQCFAYL